MKLRVLPFRLVDGHPTIEEGAAVAFRAKILQLAPEAL
jgi:hypothetical protein